MSKDRVEIFSDAVFAIIMTLLVLELHVPKIVDHSSLGQYSAALVPLVPKFISFVLTFVMISIHWVNHHYFFRHIARTPIGLVWLNNIFLLLLCFLPFPTAMLGDHPTDQFPILLYAVNSLLLGFTFLAFRSYARSTKLFKNEDEKAMGPRHSIPAITIYSLSILFVFINVYISLALFLLVPLLYFAPNLIHLTTLLKFFSKKK